MYGYCELIVALHRVNLVKFMQNVFAELGLYNSSLCDFIDQNEIYVIEDMPDSIGSCIWQDLDYPTEQMENGHMQHEGMLGIAELVFSNCIPRTSILIVIENSSRTKAQGDSHRQHSEATSPFEI